MSAYLELVVQHRAVQGATLDQREADEAADEALRRKEAARKAEAEASLLHDEWMEAMALAEKEPYKSFEYKSPDFGLCGQVMGKSKFVTPNCREEGPFATTKQACLDALGLRGYVCFEEVTKSIIHTCPSPRLTCPMRTL